MSSKTHILKGDTVQIRRGREKGKTGVVKAIFPTAAQATVEGLNVVKRHLKQGQQGQNMGGSMQTGGIIEKESPLPISALSYVCDKCKVSTRLRRGKSSSGVSQRICVKCGEPARESVRGA